MTPAERLEVGRRIRMARAWYGWSIPKLARMAECNPGHLRQIEAGRREIGRATAAALRNALGVPVVQDVPGTWVWTRNLGPIETCCECRMRELPPDPPGWDARKRASSSRRKREPAQSTSRTKARPRARAAAGDRQSAASRSASSAEQIEGQVLLGIFAPEIGRR